MARRAKWAAIGLGALHVANSVVASTFRGADVPIDKLAKDLDKYGESGRFAGQMTRLLGEDISNFDAAAMEGGFNQNLGLMLENIAGIGHLFGSSATQSQEAIQSIDQALAAMVQGGNLEGAAKAYERLEKAAKKQGVAVKDVKQSFSMYHAALDASLSKSEAAGSTFESLAEAGYTLTQTMDALYGATIQFANAEIAAEAAADDFKTAMEESSGSMDVNTEAGRKAKSAMLGLIGAAIAAAQAKYDETGSTEEATETYYEYIGALKEVLRQAGYTEKQIEDLIADYAKIPDEIRTDVYAKFHWNKGDYQSFKQAQAEAAAHMNARGAIYNADGNVLAFANGGEHHVAQIARPGDWRVWAEDETGGEAYIPLAASKRGRSMAIWRETGRRLGAMDSSITAQDIVRALESAGGRGPITIQMHAWTDRFNLGQVNRELEMHGVV